MRPMIRTWFARAIQETPPVSPMSTRMTRANTLLLTLALAVATLAPSNVALAQTSTETWYSDAEWVLRGGGWGHGVGMSQYGAYGMALEGRSAAEIIGHYYSGATLADLAGRTLPTWWSEPYPLVIGLAQHQSTVDLQPLVGVAQICQLAPGGASCAASHTIPTSRTWFVKTRPGDTCSVVDHNGSEMSVGSCDIEVSWEDNSSTSPYAVNRLKSGNWDYAHGTLRTARAINGDGLDVLLDIDMEQYLRGLAEMPSTWHPEALKAQVVAARNYTVRKVLDNSNEAGLPARTCQCHLYRDTRDQEYRAWTKEGIQPNGWVDAVAASPNLVAIHPPSGTGVFTAYYSSSTGGYTEANEDVWGGEPLPYLRSVDDRWAVSTAVNNTKAKWEERYFSSQIAAMLGWDEVMNVELSQKAPGAVVHIEGIDSGQSVSVDLNGERLRTKLDLESSHVVAITGPDGLRDIADSVHFEDIMFISELGITKGCNPPDNTRYCPTDSVTRGQMAAFLGRAVGLGGESARQFSDDDGSVFEADIARLADAGITMGCNPPSNDRFCPDRPVTRGEMAAFLVRAFGFSAIVDEASDATVAEETTTEVTPAHEPDGDPLDGVDTQAEDEPSAGEEADASDSTHPIIFDPEFVDDDGSEFAGEIAALARVGVTLGCNPPDNDRFCPADSVTREQMASFLARAIRLQG